MLIPELSIFRLVGGTSLSLQLGHRISVDLDFFTDKYFDLDELRRAIQLEIHTIGMISVSRTGFSCIIENVKCDFYNWSVPFIEDLLTEDGIRLDGIKDISAFKLDAIITRKEKKDFVDIDVLLEKFSFKDLMEFYKTKYPYNDIKIVMDALSEIDIADSSEEPYLLIKKDWNIVKEKIKRSWKDFQMAKLQMKDAEREERIRKAEELLNKKRNED
jgi:hypothetical protein